jgi:hypothetical protein
LEENPLPKAVKKLRGIEAYHLELATIEFFIQSAVKKIEINGIAQRKDAYR